MTAQSATASSSSDPRRTPTLMTERLVLRPWRVDDDAETRALFRYASDPAVGPAAAWPPHISETQSAEIIRTVLSAPQTFAVVLKPGDEAVGSIGLKPLSGLTEADDTERRDAMEIGYWIGTPFWGRGLITEAAREVLRHGFEDLGLAAVWGTHDLTNISSSKVMDKLGLSLIRVHRHAHLALLGEVYRDEAVRRITAAQWRGRR